MYQISNQDLDKALRCVAAVREAVGDDVDLLIEGHGRFDIPTSVRIAKELEAQRKFLASLEAKLSNENFVSRAPEAVVNAEREKAKKTMDLIAQLEESEAAMKKL